MNAREPLISKGRLVQSGASRSANAGNTSGFRNVSTNGGFNNNNANNANALVPGLGG